jgi:flagellar protein FliS
MYASPPLRQYQQQAIASASAEQLIVKLYDAGIAACYREDRVKLRAVLRELIGSLNFAHGGEIAPRLYDLYDFFLTESIQGNLHVVGELMGELREAWRSTTTPNRQAA